MYLYHTLIITIYLYLKFYNLSVKNKFSIKKLQIKKKYIIMNYHIKFILFLMTIISISFVISQLYNFKIEEKKNNNNIFKIEYFKFNILMGSIILIFLYYKLYFT